jgi:MoaA/NifB/PqqE/SkfB family radical SAM enzyme
MKDKKVDIKIGFSCNNACVFCVQGDKRRVFGDKDERTVLKLLRRNAESSSQVVFTGGEPTLHPGLLNFIREARRLGYREIQIQSNGRRFAYSSFCREAMARGANHFSIALHGSKAHIHDQLTMAPGSFKQTTQGIVNLKAASAYVSTNTVITSANFRDLPSVARLLIRLGVDQLQFAFPHILHRAAENASWLIPRKSETAAFVRRAVDLCRAARKRVMVEAFPPCVLGEAYASYISEHFIPETRVYDADIVVARYGVYRRTVGKLKRVACRRCVFDDFCEGPWKEYPERFGWSEFCPVVGGRRAGR